jgi:hypothetical protein
MRRRWSGGVVLPGTALTIVLLATGCGSGAVGGAIKSLAPSVSISLPARSTGAEQPSPTAVAPAAPAQASGTPAASTGSGSSLTWLWALLGALVFIGLVALVVRAGRRGPSAADGWRSRSVDAYARGAALYDAMRMAEAPGAAAAPGAAERWADIQRRADDLGQVLYALREAAPDEDARERVGDALISLQSARTAMAAERGPGAAAVPPERVRSMLVSFGTALQGLRPPGERLPY